MILERKITKAVLTFLLCLTMLGSTNAAFAAGTGTKMNGTDASAAAQTIAQTATVTQSNSAEYLHEEQFSVSHSMTGIFPQFTEYFEAGDWKISKATITLRYTATQLEDKDISSVTLSLNGKAFCSQRITPDSDGKIQELEAKLPVEDIIYGQNSISVNAYMVTKGCTCGVEGNSASKTDGCSCCADDNSGAVWMQVTKESSVALQYLPKATYGTIADFCRQFTSIDALENKQSTVAVRSDADDTVLTCASLVLAGISGQAKMYYGNINLAATDDEKALYSGKFRIYISKYSSLMQSISNSLTEGARQAAQNGAVMVLLGSTNGSNVLLLTGNSDDALLNAAKLIGNSAYINQIQTTWRSVTAGENVLMPKAEANQFKQLTTTGISLKGRGERSSSFYIELPNNRKLAYSSQVNLSMRYSDNLDFSRALVTVYINDKPIGSKSLEKDKAQGDTAVFDIPSDLNVNGNFTLKVMFDLEDYHNCCDCEIDELPWAWISSESSLRITSENVDTLLFENYPSPFVKDGAFNNVVAVLPDSPGSADLETLRLILLTMGRYLDDNTGSLRIVHASSVGDVTSSNVISIGNYSKNLIVQKNNDKLFFKFSTDGSTLSSNEKMLIDANYGKSLGTVQLLVSPFSAGKYALLVVTGVSDEAMLHGVKYIGSTENIWKIYGDGYVADGESVFPYRFKIDNAKTESVVAQVLTRTDIRNVAYTAGLVIILSLIAVIFAFRKYRKARKRD